MMVKVHPRKVMGSKVRMLGQSLKVGVSMYRISKVTHSNDILPWGDLRHSNINNRLSSFGMADEHTL